MKVSTMSDDDLSRWICEQRGWRLIICAVRGGKEHWHAPHPNGGEEYEIWACLPDFRTDLDACFEVLEHVVGKGFAELSYCGLESAQPKWRYFCKIVPHDAQYGLTKQDAIILAVLAAGGKE